MMITEKDAWSMNGYLGIIVILLLLSLVMLNIFQKEVGFVIIFSLIAIAIASGLTWNEPNEALIIMFLGNYIGSVRRDGILVAAPFSSRKKISLRIQTRTEYLTITTANDLYTNVKVVLIYKIVDSAKAVFEVESLDEFISLQSEAVMQGLLGKNHGNDHMPDQIEILENISEALLIQMQKKLSSVGIELIETHVFIS